MWKYACDSIFIKNGALRMLKGWKGKNLNWIRKLIW